MIKSFGAAIAATLTLAACAPAAQPSQPTSRPTKAAASPAVTATAPTAAERAAYLAAITRIDPGLAADEERALRRAGRICERIRRPAEGGTLTLEQYAVKELSGGNATINEAQARQVIEAVKVWCR